jgi:hypothetical protein
MSSFLAFTSIGTYFFLGFSYCFLGSSFFLMIALATIFFGSFLASAFFLGGYFVLTATFFVSSY